MSASRKVLRVGAGHRRLSRLLAQSERREAFAPSDCDRDYWTRRDEGDGGFGGAVAIGRGFDVLRVLPRDLQQLHWSVYFALCCRALCRACTLRTRMNGDGACETAGGLNAYGEVLPPPPPLSL